MKVCVCYFLGKHSFGGEKHLSGPPKGSGGKKLFSGPPKGSRRGVGGGGRREKALLWTPPSRGKEERQGSLNLAKTLHQCKIQLPSCFKHQ